MSAGPTPSGRRRKIGPQGGEVSVFVADERVERPGAEIQPSLDADRWVRLAAAVLHAEGVRGEAELSVLFVEESAIAELNAQFMHAQGPTDVLAFPIDGDVVTPGRWPDGGDLGPDRDALDLDDLPLLLGDVVICPTVAARNAPDHAGTLDDEIALLLVHGILHLFGMDHAADDERIAMQARERALLATHHGPLARDPWTDR